MIFIPYIQFQAISYHTHILIWYYIILYGLHHPNYLMLFVAKVSATSARTASNRRVFDGQANYLRWKNVRHKAPGATGEWGVRSGGKVWHWTKKPCLGDFLDCPREFVQCQVRLRKDQWLILTNMWKFWHVCQRLVGDNLPLLCCVQHVGHDWISTGFLSQNGRQAALKMTQAHDGAMSLCPAWVSHFNSRCPGFLWPLWPIQKGICHRSTSDYQDHAPIFSSEALQKRLDANMHKWILEVGHNEEWRLVSSIGYGRVWSRLDPGKNVGVKLTSKQSTLKESLSGRRRP